MSRDTRRSIETTMQNSFLIGLLAGGLAGAGAAAMTTLVITPDAPVRDAPAPASENLVAIDVSAVRGEVAALRAENEDLALRLALLEARPAPDPASRVPVEAEESPAALALRAEDTTRPVPLASNVSQGLEFRTQVEEAVQAIREEETRERELARATAREERREKRITELTEKLSLDDFQVGEMRTALILQDERRGELFDLARETGDRGAVRDGMRDIAEETRTTLARVLTPDQLEGYQRYTDELRGRDDSNRRSNRGGNNGSSDTGSNRNRRR